MSSRSLQALYPVAIWFALAVLVWASVAWRDSHPVFRYASGARGDGSALRHRGAT